MISERPVSRLTERLPMAWSAATTSLSAAGSICWSIGRQCRILSRLRTLSLVRCPPRRRPPLVPIPFLLILTLNFTDTITVKILTTDRLCPMASCPRGTPYLTDPSTRNKIPRSWSARWGTYILLKEIRWKSTNIDEIERIYETCKIDHFDQNR